jgi:hypothetical protein
MGTSKHCRAGATTGSNAPLCPPAAPALGREFRKKKAMMALAQAEIGLQDSESFPNLPFPFACLQCHVCMYSLGNGYSWLMN